MNLGGNLLENYVSAYDATVVARARSAGASVVGTATCEDLCFSGSSFTSASGAVRNPYDLTRSSGGSSSGSAVLVATDDADLAFGTDQGGSVRNPAAWSGVCGLKPTFGLVPYTGAFSLELTLDHVGLLARHAHKIALLLGVVAGPSDTDPRQCGIDRATTSYLEKLDQPLCGLRVGTVQEGFDWPGTSDPESDELVRKATQDLSALGAYCQDVSVPMHRHANDIHVPIMCEGSLATVFEQNGQGSNRLGQYDPELAQAFGNALHAKADYLPVNAKITVAAASLLRESTCSSVFARAENLRRTLCKQYDAALAENDILVMPTVPMPAHPLPSGRLSPVEHHRLAFEMHCNNCAANLTGHPAMSVPCGMIRGLPVGLLIVGRHFDEETVLRVGHQYQLNVFACPTPPIAGSAA
jgi:amidase